MKFNVSMDDELFNKFDEFSKNVHVNRSAIISMAVQQYMDAQQKIPTLLSQLDELATMMPVFRGGIEEVKKAVEGVQTNS